MNAGEISYQPTWIGGKWTWMRVPLCPMALFLSENFIRLAAAFFGRNFTLIC
jgi:hypothetical protein